MPVIYGQFLFQLPFISHLFSSFQQFAFQQQWKTDPIKIFIHLFNDRTFSLTVCVVNFFSGGLFVINIQVQNCQSDDNFFSFYLRFIVRFFLGWSQSLLDFLILIFWSVCLFIHLEWFHSSISFTFDLPVCLYLSFNIEDLKFKSKWNKNI